jgi:ribosome recycling factor
MDLDTIMLETEESMEKAVDYLRSELKGVRTGRASAGLVEFVKVEAYGAETDMRSIAMISVPEPTQIVIKPFDPSTLHDCVRGIEKAGLGLNPMVDGKQIRLNIPPLSGERRKQLAGTVKQMGEHAKVTIRNARRDGNKHLDGAAKDKSLGLSEDDIASAKEDVQELVKKYEHLVEEMVTHKTKEIEEA